MEKTRKGAATGACIVLFHCLPNQGVQSSNGMEILTITLELHLQKWRVEMESWHLKVHQK